MEFGVIVDFDDSILEPEEPSAVLEKLDLRDLHERVMSQPYFDALEDVELEMSLHPQTIQTFSQMSGISQKLEAMLLDILQPWSARGIVTVTRARF